MSEASLSRFAKKCGYRGYREFIYQYEESFVEKNEFATSNIKLVLNTYQELLNKAYKLVDESQVARISNYLSTYRVFVCGIGNSGLAAKEMAMRFMRVGVDINAITDSDLIKMNTVFQNPNCLSIGISISGEKEEIIFFLKEAHKNGAKTVLIIPKAARLTPKGSDEPVGFLPSAKTAAIVSILSAIPTTCPSIVFAVSLSAFNGK